MTDMQNRPVAAGQVPFEEQCVTAQQVYRGNFLDLRCDVVQLHDGLRATREYVVHPGAVMVVPMLADGQLVLERQYRYPLRQLVIEFPAGKVDVGESTFDCAVRELAEETGYRAREWAHAGVMHNAAAYSTESIEVWFARDLQPGPARPDVGEHIEVFTASPRDVADWVRDGTITDAKTMVGLLWLQQWHSGAWGLKWMMADGPLRPG
jgi:ADP-ribose pyrophosphatase